METKNYKNMNKICRLFVILVMLAMTLTAAAQDRINNAIDEFLNDKKSSVFINSQTKADELVPEIQKKALYKMSEFRIERSDRDKLEKLRKVFIAESNNAYKVLMKDANSEGGEMMTVAYGANLDKTTIFGVNNEYNYIVLNIKDPDDSTWRWCFALEWHESKIKSERSNDCYLMGTIVTIYSRDPATERNTQNNVAVRTTILPDGTVVTYNSDNDTKTVVYKNSNVVGNGSTEYSDVDSPSRFRVIFGNLRSLFLDAKREKSGLAMQTTIASRMLDLCKNKGSLLSKDERALCRTTLIDMSNVAEDKYVTGLLRMAADALK